MNSQVFRYALRTLARKGRKLWALGLIYSVVVAFFASAILFTSALRTETQAVLRHLPELWVQRLAGGRLVPMPQHFADSLAGIRGVQAALPRYWGYQYDAPTGAVFTVMGTDSLPQGLTMPHKPRPLQPDEAWVGTGVLELRGIHIGEAITLLDAQGKIQSFRIAGAFTAETDLLTRDLILLAPTTARRLLGLADTEMTDVALRVYNEAEVDNIGRKIDRRYAGVRVVSAAQLRATYNALFGWRGGIFIFGASMSILALLVLVWERAMGLTREERHELGVLKALGWQINEVLWLKMYEGFIISFTATLIGIVAAYLHVFWLDAPLLRPLLTGWSVLYPSYRLLPVVQGADIILILALSICPYLLATLIPAWRGAITDPAEVMNE